MASPDKYLEQLLISKVRIKSIRHFFMNPDTPIHLRGAVRELDEEINAVRRELSRMEQIGLLHAEKKGNRKYFQLNKEFIFFDELMGIVHKTFGLGGAIVVNMKKLGGVKFALLTQSFTKGIQFGANDIDLMVIGDDLDMALLQELVERQEKKLEREIHYTVLKSDEYELRKRRRDIFVNEIMSQDFVMVIGDKLEFLGSGSET